jgi:hypothetical protein
VVPKAISSLPDLSKHASSEEEKESVHDPEESNSTENGLPCSSSDKPSSAEDSQHSRQKRNRCKTGKKRKNYRPTSQA